MMKKYISFFCLPVKPAISSAIPKSYIPKNGNQFRISYYESLTNIIYNSKNKFIYNNLFIFFYKEF